MRPVLDGIEDQSYKLAQIVRLYRGVPNAEVAQLVEFLPSKQIVASSSLVFRSSIENPH